LFIPGRDQYSGVNKKRRGVCCRYAPRNPDREKEVETKRKTESYMYVHNSLSKRRTAGEQRSRSKKEGNKEEGLEPGINGTM